MAKAQASKKASNKSSQNDNRPMAMSKIAEEDENKSPEQEEEINSGFGSYMRSGEGQSIIHLYYSIFYQHTIGVRCANLFLFT